MKKNRRQSELKYLERRLPKAPSSSRANFRHRDRGIHAGRVRGA